ncbi:hypothetical protein BGZ99_008210 [Dissophora globulifera]|uniref:Uncharacterized protein n=1 Tax=Dissophora globulifera TaxID=979702 RepID=A0A9P6UPY1_9FUNG|nr:hypothetical protein BGZ99_008210 [Dissophora globulifera]
MNYGHSQRQKSVLETYIERACNPMHYEPDLALNLEICDVIKEKQQNTPREAASYIVRLVNHKNMHVGMLALTLLDNCVKNCGYPFHLQIATKEFLNSLVRRFPERPLTVPTPVQTRILELIQEWYTTLCKTSRYKEDLVHIRDMHRLLAFKGYRFLQTKNTAATILNPVESLKSPAELEEEDRVAQAAEQAHKPDYAQQASAELEKILRKATFLMEMLNDVKPGEIELFGTCKAAQPKVQKIIKDNEDPDNMNKWSQLNEILSSVIEQYQQVKAGNLVKVTIPEATEEGYVVRNEPGPVSTPTQQQSSVIDLLDFDGTSDGSSPPAVSPRTTGNLMDDLLNLSFNDAPPPPSWGAVGSISLGQLNNGNGRPVSISSSSTSSPGGGAPNYNVFSAPITSVNPISVGSSVRPSSLTQLKQVPPPMSTPDDFEFVSNTGAPQHGAGPFSVVLFNKNGLQIDLDIEKQPIKSDRALTYRVKAYFSNSQNSPLSSLTFRVAVPKTLHLKLDPQSAQAIPPFSKKTVTQEMTITAPSETTAVRLRYHVSYVHNGRTIDEQGEFSQFS